MDLDPSANLKDVENSLRNVIFLILKEKYHDRWVESTGVTGDRIVKWHDRREEEKKRQKSGTIEDRLMYYSDFYDLKTIINRNWELFSNIFLDKKTIDVFLTQLEKYRDPDAHRRDLFSYQKMLIAGISGEIRALITKYHSKKATGSDCFPRIESVRDNLGNACTFPGVLFCNSEMILRPGDRLEFLVAASDPEGIDLEYRISTDPGTFLKIDPKWQKSEVLQYDVTEENISKRFSVVISVRSLRSYHANGDTDDSAQFIYTVLPTP